MGGSVGKSGSESGSSTAFDQNVFQPQSDALSALYGQAANLFGQSTMGGKSGVSDPSQITSSGQQYSQQALDASMPAWEEQLSGGVYGDMGLQDQLMQSLNMSMSNPSAMQEINNMIMGGSGNNYADAMRDQYIADATEAQENMMANLDARAAASGMSGSSRHGITEAQGMEDINDALTSNLAELGYETFDADLDRKLQIAQQADMNTLSREQMMQQMLGSQNQTVNQGISNLSNIFGTGVQQQMVPWDMMSAYANVIGAPTVLSSGQGSSSSEAKGFGASGGK